MCRFDEDETSFVITTPEQLYGLAKLVGSYDFEGKRYDMGNKLGIMKANCEIALTHDEIGEGFKEYLKELVKTF